MDILTTNYGISPELVKKAEELETSLKEEFNKIEKIQEKNQLWVLDCFREERIQPSLQCGNQGKRRRKGYPRRIVERR